MSDWSETMRALLGKRVEVTLSVEENVKISGILHSFTDDGEVCVEEDGGSYRWGWPNLHIREMGASDARCAPGEVRAP